ncbi:MAG: hypothetical protein A2845_00425 [Candidatus Lloydbacteria bacterium RIFCSPHIGHO2_01_FULL_49_22]|uniref:General secretion pathway GspH domain-containing protein n=1 Tax=Candidatus Lloydbacteria bacterium RIFCSPHIGHO2_01_FULL_49_22 TaxID=1798658 RepID=A0A1G2CYB2_9BACT|nr:MAG: hypothetical protein A2845_00425 [Candidatus Lloydbacteria bacterium RIFCSPHIGHO2_01_FULL_49_22]OGZ09328.1 MAG: hypothetical protein A3C14_05330 [Candidatus Lloydbacteria bacterium RIFCSPHIGHO2_02_FULL_50_18]
MLNSQHTTRGVTLVEILLVIAITILLASVVLSSFGQYRLRQSLAGSIESVLAAISAAHLNTISSKNDSPYGVNLKPDEAIYFAGDSYPGDTDPANIHYVLPATIEIANVSLNGGDTKIYFKKLMGATDNYGTFDIRAKTSTGVGTTVTIYQTGATSI